MVKDKKTKISKETKGLIITLVFLTIVIGLAFLVINKDNLGTTGKAYYRGQLVSLSDYPSPFIEKGQLNAVVVVGDSAPAGNIVSAVGIVNSLSIVEVRPRFVVKEDIVLDGQTGLTWQKGTGSGNWKEAFIYCEQSSTGGIADWRLPSNKELDSIADVGNAKPFDSATAWFWSSTETSAENAYARNLRVGGTEYDISKTIQFAVRCVRKKEIKICQKIYAPVCGSRIGVSRTYPNKCELDVAGAQFL